MNVGSPSHFNCIKYKGALSIILKRVGTKTKRNEMKYAQRGFRNKASKILRECPPKEQNQHTLNVTCADVSIESHSLGCQPSLYNK